MNSNNAHKKNNETTGNIYREQDMYRSELIELYKHPEHWGILINPDIHIKDFNPSCGDHIEISASIEAKKFKEIKFQGVGCVISTISTSLLADYLEGKPIETVKKMHAEDMMQLLDIQLSPARIKCATLSLQALQKGVNEFESKKK